MIDNYDKHLGYSCGHQVIATQEKGRGVITDKPFLEGDFLCEYCGDVIDLKEATKREDGRSEDKGCFMFYFEHDGKKLW